MAAIGHAAVVAGVVAAAWGGGGGALSATPGGMCTVCHGERRCLSSVARPHDGMCV